VLFVLPAATRGAPSLTSVAAHGRMCLPRMNTPIAELLDDPKAAFVTRLRPAGLPTKPLVSYQVLPTTSWVDPSSTG
jgi:hypothetical protein